MPIKLLNDYFGFNRQQRNGVAVLIGISLLLLVLRISYPYFLEEPPAEIKMLPLADIKDSVRKSDSNTEVSVAKGFKFDPNTASLQELQDLGLSQKTAATLDKFRKKGFKFKNAEDLKKVYGISQQQFEQMAPLVKIAAEKIPQEKIKSQTKAVAQTEKMDLNTADSLMLIGIRGIGPSFSKRILKYREILGGFVAVEQLKEVYGFTEELYNSVAPSFTVNTALVHKLDLNRDEFKIINKHPYITYEMTREIFNWRRKTTITKQNLPDILKDNRLYERLLPYLELP